MPATKEKVQNLCVNLTSAWRIIFWQWSRIAIHVCLSQTPQQQVWHEYLTDNYFHCLLWGNRGGNHRMPTPHIWPSLHHCTSVKCIMLHFRGRIHKWVNLLPQLPFVLAYEGHFTPNECSKHCRLVNSPFKTYPRIYDNDHRMPTMSLALTPSSTRLLWQK